MTAIYGDAQSVLFAGSMRTAKVRFGRKWITVEFDFGLSVKVNPHSRFHGSTVWLNGRLAALKAVECLEGLSNKRLEPFFDFALSGGGSTQENAWLCKRLNVTKVELRELREARRQKC